MPMKHITYRVLIAIMIIITPKTGLLALLCISSMHYSKKRAVDRFISNYLKLLLSYLKGYFDIKKERIRHKF